MTKDLVVLCADKNQEFALRSILGRRRALGLRAIAFDVHVHPERDPGCLARGTNFLGPLSSTYKYALLVFDHAGCGSEHRAAQDLETACEDRMRQQGWLDHAVIVIEPELESWVWSYSVEVDAVLGWAGRKPALREWLAAKGIWPAGEIKPPDPKKAVEVALRAVRKPRSSALYGQLAERVSLIRCSDRAFCKLRTSLQSWFSAP